MNDEIFSYFSASESNISNIQEENRSSIKKANSKVKVSVQFLY